jgi:L-serine dehydratase
LESVSILNHVLGPVMHGPSSSHTAGAFHIGRLARDLLGDEPAAATVAFDPAGSYAQCYVPQGADRAFAAGLLGWEITDPRFPMALQSAPEQGLDIRFAIEGIPGADHPNALQMRLRSRAGRRLSLRADSVGGGAVVITRLEGWPVTARGEAHNVFVELDPRAQAADLLLRDGQAASEPETREWEGRNLVYVRRRTALDASTLAELRALAGVHQVWTARPVFFVQHGEPLFSSAAQMTAIAQERGCSLGQAALAYESQLLGLPEEEVVTEVMRRFAVMRESVNRGLGADLPPMRLLRPSAGEVYRAEAEGKVGLGGLHTRAAARAMAVMHVNAGMGLVCAAPTAGAAGVLPAVVVTLQQEKGIDERGVALALLASGAVGVVVASRATFAAEIAGCQVEIGASGAMAAAAVVEAFGGSATKACDAAAISLQNTMGMVCDLVQGTVEIPCHTRNAVAASSAFVCADLVMGGYENPIPLDETVDAVREVGEMLPSELRCTSRGGLALTPSAQALPHTEA